MNLEPKVAKKITPIYHRTILSLLMYVIFEARPLTKDQRIRWGHIKLDLGERKTKRAAKVRIR